MEIIKEPKTIGSIFIIGGIIIAVIFCVLGMKGAGDLSYTIRDTARTIVFIYSVSIAINGVFKGTMLWALGDIAERTDASAANNSKITVQLEKQNELLEEQIRLLSAQNNALLNSDSSGESTASNF